MTVTAYLQAGQTYDFPAKNKNHAREIAGRIIKEGLWITEDNSETFYGLNQVYKVKITNP